MNAYTPHTPKPHTQVYGHVPHIPGNQGPWKHSMILSKSASFVCDFHFVPGHFNFLAENLFKQGLFEWC